jgi:hypothetical protein
MLESLLMVGLLAQDLGAMVRETAYARGPRARAIAGDRELLLALDAKNLAGETLDEIHKKDQRWMAEKSYPLRRELTTSSCAARLRALTADDPTVVEAFLMDHQGAVVCSTVETSDYWQGDEAKWQKTFRDGKPFFVDEPALDASAGVYGIQLSVLVEQAGKRKGALTLTLRLDRKLLQPKS